MMLQSGYMQVTGRRSCARNGLYSAYLVGPANKNDLRGGMLPQAMRSTGPSPRDHGTG